VTGIQELASTKVGEVQQSPKKKKDNEIIPRAVITVLLFKGSRSVHADGGLLGKRH